MSEPDANHNPSLRRSQRPEIPIICVDCPALPPPPHQQVGLLQSRPDSPHDLPKRTRESAGLVRTLANFD
ncbi:hypothetical protein MTP99_016090 [Tenebrio molitor]|nr:hypothetical protein MTP99_016090 [Tenebrio molitor]